MKQLRLVKPNLLKVDHNAISDCVPGGLEYLMSFCFPGTSNPIALYRVKDQAKASKNGYKEYMGLELKTFNSQEYAIFNTYTTKELQPYRYLEAVYCPLCGDVVYWSAPGPTKRCSCESVYIVGDGENSFFGGSDNLSEFKLVYVDLLSGRVVREWSNEEH